MRCTHKMCIYRLISPSGKSYVGQARDYYDRQYHRLLDYRRWLEIKDDMSKSDGERRGSNPRLYLAFLKYGVDNFKSEILEENIETQQRLNELEEYYIDFYDCINRGYNVCSGGNFGINPETGRSYNYGKTVYSVNVSDNPKAYRKEYYDKNQNHLLWLTKQYRLEHPEKVIRHRLENRERENERRRRQNRYLREADAEIFGTNDFGNLFRRCFGGGRTRSRGFVFPRGNVNEQGCWMFADK